MEAPSGLYRATIRRTKGARLESLARNASRAIRLPGSPHRPYNGFAVAVASPLYGVLQYIAAGLDAAKVRERRPGFMSSQ